MSGTEELVAMLRDEYIECRLKAAKLGDEIGRLRKQLSTTESHADDLLAQLRQYEDAAEPVVDEGHSEEAGDAADSSNASGGSVAPGVSVFAVNSNVAILPPSRIVPAEDESWKAAPITVLRLAEIQGLGPSKRTRLIDAVPTMGALENIRAEASLKCLPFASLLPKGIGQATADEIEERALNWLRDHQGRLGVKADTGKHEAEPPPELDQIPDIRLKRSSVTQTREMARDYLSPPPTPEEVVKEVVNPWIAGTPVMPEGVVIDAEPSGGESEAESTVDQSEAEAEMEPEDSPEYLRYRYQKMLKRAESAGPLLGSIFPGGDRNTTYEDGREAARRGYSLDDCNWSPGERQDQWLLGFIAENGRPESQNK